MKRVSQALLLSGLCFISSTHAMETTQAKGDQSMVELTEEQLFVLLRAFRDSKTEDQKSIRRLEREVTQLRSQLQTRESLKKKAAPQISQPAAATVIKKEAIKSPQKLKQKTQRPKRQKGFWSEFGGDIEKEMLKAGDVISDTLALFGQ